MACNKDPWLNLNKGCCSDIASILDPKVIRTPHNFTFCLHLTFFFSGTSHDWRLRCDAVNLYYTLFGLTRPSCLPLPELGLVLNLKEKKAVLNPTIKPELGVSAVMDTPASIGIHGVGMSYTAVSGVGSFNFQDS